MVSPFSARGGSCWSRIANSRRNSAARQRCTELSAPEQRRAPGAHPAPRERRDLAAGWRSRAGDRAVPARQEAARRVDFRIQRLQEIRCWDVDDLQGAAMVGGSYATCGRAGPARQNFGGNPAAQNSCARQGPDGLFKRDRQKRGQSWDIFANRRKRKPPNHWESLEAPPGFEPGVEVLQTGLNCLSR